MHMHMDMDMDMHMHMHMHMHMDMDMDMHMDMHMHMHMCMCHTTQPRVEQYGLSSTHNAHSLQKRTASHRRRRSAVKAHPRPLGRPSLDG